MKEHQRSCIIKGSKVRSITYTPDFVDPNGKWIIETKGYANESFPLRWKLFKRHLKENNLAYVLFMPRNKDTMFRSTRINKTIIKRGYVKLCAIVSELRALREGPFFY